MVTETPSGEPDGTESETDTWLKSGCSKGQYKPNVCIIIKDAMYFSSKLVVTSDNLNDYSEFVLLR